VVLAPIISSLIDLQPYLIIRFNSLCDTYILMQLGTHFSYTTQVFFT